MSLLQLVVFEGKPVNGPLRFRDLPAGDQNNLLPASTHMQSPHTSAPGNPASPQGVAGSVDQQIATMERMAFQHFPDDEAGRATYLAGLLKQRLREYGARFQRLEVRAM